MKLFAQRVPRCIVLAVLLAGFCLISPETLSRGPDLCLWRHLFHLSTCPACGSTRALAAFFHGHFGRALAFNRNIVVTAPLLVGLLLDDLRNAVNGPRVARRRK
jgi:hypothetical protein